MQELTLIHLYPDLMNLYGDRGNILALTRRCEWRGIRLHTIPVSLGDRFRSDQADLVFIGGGQDYEQGILQDDVLTKKRDEILKAVESDVVFLAICGGYQLLGHYYLTHEGKRIDCLGAIDAYTVGGTKRLIGNLVFACPFLPEGGKMVVGFENHSGKTYRGPSLRPLGNVLYGNGNNAEDGTEGAAYRNVFCSYSHGSLLPKNPALADFLIGLAMKRRYPSFEGLTPLSDTLEQTARSGLLKRFLK
jgi:lipid II isoglutaminyl synthase (glutamine-hydrolysing)